MEAFDVFCLGQILYEISVGTPFYLKVLSSTTNNVINQSFNTAVIEGRDALPHQLPDSLSKKQTYLACIPYWNCMTQLIIMIK